MKHSSTIDQLRFAQQLIRQGQFSGAIERLQKLTAANPPDVRVYSLLGVAFAQSKRWQDSVSAFRRAVELNPNDASGQRNLASALARSGQDEAAVAVYQAALKLDPGNARTLFNLAMSHCNLKQWEAAAGVIGACLKLDRRNWEAWQLAAQIAQAMGNDDEALKHYEQCIGLNPGAGIALQGKALILKQQGDFDQSVKASEQLIRLSPRNAAAYQMLGGTYAAQGKAEPAIDAYRAAVDLEPLNFAHHRRLNQLLWVEGRDDFLQSYNRTLQEKPAAHGLRRELAFKLFQVDRLPEALHQAERLVDEEPEESANHQLLGGVLRKRHDFAKAIEAHRRAVKLDPQSLDCQQELATSLLANWEADSALRILADLHAREPLHQGYLALKSTALRMLESDEYHDLVNYGKLVFKTVLQPPPGYSSIESFNAELKDYLITLHSGKEHPLDQSLVNGTQSIDHLFDDSHELIRLLKAAMDQETRAFLGNLPADSPHPTLSRNTRDYAYSGSWSVLLRSSGFHLNHYHSHGWYSGPYYVELPQAVDDEVMKPGWLKLGEPGFECINPLPPDQLIKPVSGLMVRFPSYMWHGTVPFESEETRLVVSLDIEPA